MVARLGNGLQLKVLGVGQEVSSELVVGTWLEVEVVRFMTEVGGSKRYMVVDALLGSGGGS